MTKPKWYSPQLSREVVARLYHRAKIEHIPMTVLANRIIGQALGSNEPTGTARAASDNNTNRESE